MTPAIPCLRCAHYFGDGKCAAFRKSIPAEIVGGRVDHREPVKGDGGIRFEARDAEAAEFFDPKTLAKVGKRLGVDLG